MKCCYIKCLEKLLELIDLSSLNSYASRYLLQLHLLELCSQVVCEKWLQWNCREQHPILWFTFCLDLILNLQGQQNLFNLQWCLFSLIPNRLFSVEAVTLARGFGRFCSAKYNPREVCPLLEILPPSRRVWRNKLATELRRKIIFSHLSCLCCLLLLLCVQSNPCV